MLCLPTRLLLKMQRLRNKEQLSHKQTVAVKHKSMSGMLTSQNHVGDCGFGGIRIVTVVVIDSLFLLNSILLAAPPKLPKNV